MLRRIFGRSRVERGLSPPSVQCLRRLHERKRVHSRDAACRTVTSPKHRHRPQRRPTEPDRQRSYAMWTKSAALLVTAIALSATICDRASATCACCCTGFAFPLCDVLDAESCVAICASNQETAHECSPAQLAICCDLGTATDCVSGAPVCSSASPTNTPTNTPTGPPTVTPTAPPSPVPAVSTRTLLLGMLLLAVVGGLALVRRQRREPGGRG